MVHLINLVTVQQVILNARTISWHLHVQYWALMMVSVLVHSGLAHDFVSLLLTMTLVKKQNKNSTVCDLSVLTFMPSLSLITGLHLFTSSWGFLSGPEQSFGIPRGPAALAVSLKQVQARPPPTHPESRYSHFKHCYGAAAALMPRPTLTL